MKKAFVILFITIFSSLNYTYCQGLQFQSTIASIEKRTSYNVFAYQPETFSSKLDISFQMQLPWEGVVGYVLRVIDKPSNQIYNLFLESRGGNYFELNEEGCATLINHHFNHSNLRNKQWFDVRLIFNFETKEISLSIDDEHITIQKSNLANSMSPQIVFGRSEYLIDVPTFYMRNLAINGGLRNYLFPLQQVEGNDVYSNDGQKVGYIENPYWAINDAYHWKEFFSSSSSTLSGYGYSPRFHDAYYFNKDTFNIYRIIAGGLEQIPFSEPCPVDIYLGTCFVDDPEHALYLYETFHPIIRDGQPAVARLDLNNFTWRTESDQHLEKGQMHHHGAFYDDKRKELTIYGGFCNMTYHNDFYTYNVENHAWRLRDDIEGNALPRYYCSMGYDGERYAYIFGGMGNESGNQTVGRTFFYDLYQFDTQTNKVTKLWNADWKNNSQTVFAKGMVILDGYFYALGYNEYLSDAYMKLYRFSLADGSYSQVGDSILIHPDRVESEANLYYDPLLRIFIATILELKDFQSTTFSCYMLNHPALTEKEFASVCQPIPISKEATIIIVLSILAIVCTIGSYIYWRRKRLQNNATQYPANFESMPNSVYLFGSFAVFNHSNNNITYLFTEKIKQILAILIVNYENGGISSKDLGEIVWRDKSSEKIKNSRSVAINHLRKALQDVENIEVVYQNKNFCLEITQPFFCDYLHFCDIANNETLTPENCTDILNIVRNGRFLDQTSDEAMQMIKKTVDNKVKYALLRIMQNAVNENNTAIVLECVRHIFAIDPVCEEAYKTQIRTLKKIANDRECLEAEIRFKERYKNINGTEYTD